MVPLRAPMAWDGMSRDEIERELLTRIEFCRADYQRIFDERRRLLDTANAAQANADGMLSLQKLGSTRDALRDAQARYKSSTKAFGDYVLYGKLPQEE